jgi:hypothetical protein
MKKLNKTKKLLLLLLPICTILVIVQIFTSNIFGASNEISYEVENDWGKGANVSVTIINNDTEEIDGWTLKWDFPGDQKVNNLWNGIYTQENNIVTVTNNDWNNIIPSNGSVSFGFLLTYTDDNTSPTEFLLNEESDSEVITSEPGDNTNETESSTETEDTTMTETATITSTPESTDSWEDSVYTVDGYDRVATFESIFNLSGDKYFNENGDGKIIDGLHYGTATRTGSSQFGGHFFGDIVLPDEIKDNVIAVNKFDLFSDEAYTDPVLAGAVFEIQHLFLDESGEICDPIGTDEEKAFVIVTDSMFDEGRIQGDIDIYTTTYDKIKGSTLGGGCLFVNWKIVEFSNLSQNLKPSYKWVEANNPYYLAFKILWHKLPVESISFEGEVIDRTQDNVFKLPTQAIDVSDNADITINYLDGTNETVTIGGPEDTEIHEFIED